MPEIGVLICGHGSRDARGTREFALLADRVARRFPHWSFGHGFLEFAQPSIGDGLAALRRQGAKRIIAMPGLLFSARHARTDIPSVLHEHREPTDTIHYAEPLGFDPKMLRAAADRIEAAETAAGSRVSRRETLLMVAGRGTSDPEANGDLAKLARMLSEGMEFGWGGACYAGVTEPQTGVALDHAAKLGYRRIVVLPYFLFTGALMDRVHAATDEAAKRHSHIEFVKAAHLNDHPLVVETFSERIIAALEGPVHAHHDHDHAHDHDHDESEDEWHIHAPGGAVEQTDIYSLAPKRRASVD